MIALGSGNLCGRHSRAALIGNLSTLHSDDRFASRGRTRSISRKYKLVVLTPTSSATSVTDQNTHGCKTSSADQEDKEDHADGRALCREQYGKAWTTGES